MSDWPGGDELKTLLDIDSDGFDDRIERALAAAIEHVKTEVAGSVASFDDADPPIQITDSMAHAAVRMAELLFLRPLPEGTPGPESDPTYRRLMYGQRRRFGIA